MLIEAPGEATGAGGADAGINGTGRPSPIARWRRDASLVGAVRRGNPRAFDAIYRRHHPALLSYCRHLLGCQHEAEDAVQQTFLNAYAAIARDDRELRLRPWLYRIAHNHCISVLRRRRERTGEQIEISTAGLSSQVERREEVRQMLGDIADLPDSQRAALILSELETLSHAEISEVIGCPEKRVKALVFQARTTLGKCRDAREISCEEIREQLSVLRGGALRRSVIRRHLVACEGCRDFKLEVGRQRAAAAILLPAGTLPGMGFLLPAAAVSMGGSTAGGAGAAGAGPGSAVGAGLAGAGVGGAAIGVAVGGKTVPLLVGLKALAAAGLVALSSAVGVGNGGAPPPARERGVDAVKERHHSATRHTDRAGARRPHPGAAQRLAPTIPPTSARGDGLPRVHVAPARPDVDEAGDAGPAGAPVELPSARGVVDSLKRVTVSVVEGSPGSSTQSTAPTDAEAPLAGDGEDQPPAAGAGA